MSEKYKEGLNRNQQLLFPPSLDEYVDENNEVRAIDLYVEQLDFKELGFDDTSRSFEGQKSYEIESFLTKLATNNNVSPTMQNQAFSALALWISRLFI